MNWISENGLWILLAIGALLLLRHGHGHGHGKLLFGGLFGGDRDEGSGRRATLTSDGPRSASILYAARR